MGERTQEGPGKGRGRGARDEGSRITAEGGTFGK